MPSTPQDILWPIPTRKWGNMKKIITILTGTVLLLGLAGCGTSETTEPVTTTSSSEVTSTTAEKATTTTSNETTTQPVTEEPALEAPLIEETTAAPAPAIEETYIAPQIPPFMRPEDFDPYGPPKFVECWESNAAVMSDGSIVTDTVNCAPAPVVVDPYDLPVRSDGCVGPAAVCGYYDEYGNPIWFDKMTGETSPRYYDEYGNPTMEKP